MRSDDEGAGSNSLDLTVLAVRNSVEEIEHSVYYRLVKCLYVEDYGAACDKVICNSANLLKRRGANYLKLNIVALDG